MTDRKIFAHFALIVSALALTGSARAYEPGTNCLQWSLETEKKYVPRADDQRTSQDLLESGKAFGFHQESSDHRGRVRVHFYRYDRDVVLSDETLLAKYEEMVGTFQWRLNSQLGYRFFCSFSAPDPRPRLSGSN